MVSPALKAWFASLAQVIGAKLKSTVLDYEEQYR